MLRGRRGQKFHIRLFSLNNRRARRLNWKHMERKGDTGVIKGLSHRIVVVKAPNSIFEEAIFVIRDDVLACRGADSAAIIQEARRAANSYVRGVSAPKKNLLTRLPAPIFAAAGAAAAGLAWLAVHLCGV